MKLVIVILVLRIFTVFLELAKEGIKIIRKYTVVFIDNQVYKFYKVKDVSNFMVKGL